MRQFYHLTIKHRGRTLEEVASHLDLDGDEQRMRGLLYDAMRRHTLTRDDGAEFPLREYAMEIRTGSHNGRAKHTYVATEAA